MINQLLENFILNERAFLSDFSKREAYATREEIVNILSELEMLMRENDGKTIEELITLLIEGDIRYFEKIRKKYGVPGYTGSISVGNIKVKLYGGNINYLGEPMPENALFDIASMTKFYTQIVAYNLIKEGYFKRSDKIKDLDSRFVNLGDLTVDDILTFGVSFQTDGLIKDKPNLSEALNTLYTANVKEKGKWNYNDIGLMIMKEVMEHVTEMTYPELIQLYVIRPLNLQDTHVIVPNSKYKLVTGTPNALIGRINDASAGAVGGYSGHAGIVASSDDLVKLSRGVRERDIVPNISDAYTPGELNNAVGRMGNAYTPHPTGLETSFVDTIEPKDTFAIAGSTRVNMASSSDSTFNILFNPSSMSMEEAREHVKKINEQRIAVGKNPINPVREYEFDQNGEMVKHCLIDPREIFPLGEMEKSVKRMARTTLKLRFLDYMMKEYDKEYQEKEINVNVNGR